MTGACNSTTRDGITHIRWIHAIFGSCIYSNQDAASYILGYISIACWLNAQLPQVITNYRNKSTDGLSLPFLVNWLLGDITNLIGCLLTGQLKFQIYLATYFSIVDLVLFFQYFYYTWYQKRYIDSDIDIPIRPSSLGSFKDSILEGAKKSYTFPTRKDNSHQRLSSMVFVVLLFTFHSTSSISSSFTTSPHLSTTHDEIESQRISFEQTRSFFEHNSRLIGRVFAWTCTVLYLTSRMPQIWKNYTRRSVMGLSVFMFIFAALGNLTYTMSILLNGTGPEYLREEFPYILGSVGTLIFDVTIFIQWCIYRDPDYRHKRRRSRRSTSYVSNDLGYQELPMDGESYETERSRRSRRSRSGNGRRSDGDLA